jgi:hypothetical protein
MLGKLIALIALRRSSPVSSAFLTRAMSALGTLITLSIVVAFLASILLAGLVCLSYNLMVYYGLSHTGAMSVLALACIVILLVLILVVLKTVKRIKALATEVVVVENPIAHKVSGLVYSFLDGVLS